ncbi:MAG: hypothetical protein ABR584_12970, partial [Candidatus Baltobacteraceae bacterium]
LEVYGAGVSVMDSTVDGISSINPGDLQAAGFSAWGALIQFLRCRASNVSVQADIAIDSRGLGFGWAPDPRAIFNTMGPSALAPKGAFALAFALNYTDCVADRCDVAFDTWNHVDSSWIRPTFTNCKLGFLAEPGGKRTLSCDGCSECSPYAPVPNTDPYSVTVYNFASGNTYPH